MDCAQTGGKRPAFDRFEIKATAAAAMTLDHLAVEFVSFGQTPALYAAMRTLGRLTTPIMCFFIAEGFVHTSSKLRYGVRLALFAVISQIPYSLLHFGGIGISELNMIATLFLSFMVLCAYEYIKRPYLRLPAILFLAACCVRCDWYFFAPVWVLVFYIFHDSRKKQITGYAIISAAMIGGWIVYYAVRFGSLINLVQLGVFLAIPPLALYNGEKGYGGKAVNIFFYIYYPLHLLIIYLIKLLPS